jgi:hypothetical protein
VKCCVPLPLQCLPATPTGQHPVAPNQPTLPENDATANNSGEEEEQVLPPQVEPVKVEQPATVAPPAAPKPSPTPKDLAQELTCGDAGREEAAAVAISQAIATTGRWMLAADTMHIVQHCRRVHA